MRDAGREHVVDPEPEAQHAERHRRRHDPAVAQQRRARHHRQDRGDHAGGGQEDDVDLRMAEQPEQVLPQQAVAAVLDLEERQPEGALELEQDASPGSCGGKPVRIITATTSMYQA